MTHEPSKTHPSCPMEHTIAVIGGKWKLLILWHLSKETLRFNQLQKKLPTVTTKMLTQQLRELEKDTVITRVVYPVVPPKVEYSLSECGKELLSVMEVLQSWGVNHLSKSQ